MPQDEIRNFLAAIGLEKYIDFVLSLGAKSVRDLEFVVDDDLIRWGCTTIERRKFFKALETELGREVAAQAPVAKLDGGIEDQAVRILRSTGPISEDELIQRLQKSCRIEDAQPLVHSLVEKESKNFKTYFCDADGVVLKDSVNKTSGSADEASGGTRFFSLVVPGSAEGIFAIDHIVLQVLCFLEKPEDVLNFGLLNTHLLNFSRDARVWSRLLNKFYPKVSLENPDVKFFLSRFRSGGESSPASSSNRVKGSGKGLKRKRQSPKSTSGLKKVIIGCCEHDVAVSWGQLMESVTNEFVNVTSKEVFQCMASHSQEFRHDPDSDLYCVCPGDKHDHWLPLNPYDPVPTFFASDQNISTNDQNQNHQAQLDQIEDLDPLAAFRLHRTGLLKEAKLVGGEGHRMKAWQYQPREGGYQNRGNLPAGELLDLAEKRITCVRENDPECVHFLLRETLDGVCYHCDGGFNRRVNLLQSALGVHPGGEKTSRVRMEPEVKKRYERLLNQFMEKVRKERAFGYYLCVDCNSRWRSGFTYEHIGQECRKCKKLVLPFRIDELQTGHHSTREKVKELHFDGLVSSFDFYKQLNGCKFGPDFSFCCWVKFAQVQKNWQTLIELNDANQNTQNIWVGTVANTGILCLHLGSDWIHQRKREHIVDIRCKKPLRKNVYFHIGISISSASKQAAIFIDGVNVVTVHNFSDVKPQVRRQAWLGCDSRCKNHFKGSVCEVFFFNRAVSDREVGDLFKHNTLPRDSVCGLATAVARESTIANAEVISLKTGLSSKPDFLDDLRILRQRFPRAVIEVAFNGASVRVGGDEEWRQERRDCLIELGKIVDHYGT